MQRACEQQLTSDANRLRPNAGVVDPLLVEVVENWHACIRDEVARSTTCSYRTRWGFRQADYAVVMFPEARSLALELQRDTRKRTTRRT